MHRLKDLVRPGNDAQVRGNFADIANRIDACGRRFQLGPVDDYVGLVSQRLLRTSSREVRAAAPFWKKDIFAFAWRVRNIFECLLILNQVCSDAEKAKVFAAQKGSDERTILDSLRTLADPDNVDAAVLEARSKHISDTLERHGFGRASPWRMDVVARDVGMGDEYDAFYKLYSKYVHPSAWNVLADADEYEAPEYWQIFLLQGQLHAHQIVATAEEILANRIAGRDA